MKTLRKASNEHFTLESAKRCIRTYKDFMLNTVQLSEEQLVKAFTIHADELLEALGVHPEARQAIECRHKHVRVYIGMDQILKKDKDARDFKLFLVPVKGIVDEHHGGTDVIPKEPSPSGKPGEEEGYVYDLIAPCPNTCDIESDLYKA